MGKVCSVVFPTTYQELSQPQLWEMRCQRCQEKLTNPFFWTVNFWAAFRLLCPACHADYRSGGDWRFRPFWGLK